MFLGALFAAFAWRETGVFVALVCLRLVVLVLDVQDVCTLAELRMRALCAFCMLVLELCAALECLGLCVSELRVGIFAIPA